MLQRYDRRMKRLLDLADAIERADDFNQGCWGTCICGQAVKLYAGFVNGRPQPTITADGHASGQPYIDWGARVLDMTQGEARDLFSNAIACGPSREHAASVVRHYALTGVVDWRRGHDRPHGEVLPTAEPLSLSDVGVGA